MYRVTTLSLILGVIAGIVFAIGIMPALSRAEFPVLQLETIEAAEETLSSERAELSRAELVAKALV